MTYRYLLRSLLLISPKWKEKAKLLRNILFYTLEVVSKEKFSNISNLYYYSVKKNHKIYPFILLDFMGQYSLFKIWSPKKCKCADWWAGTALPQDKLKRLAAPAVCSAPGVQMSKLLVNQLPNHCSLQGRLCTAAIPGVGLPSNASL